MSTRNYQNTVAVAVPIYRTDLNDAEWLSLRQTIEVLSSRHVYAVAPEGLDLHPILECFPTLRVETFPAECFDGIRGCYRLNGHKLPMGCHAWTSRKMRGFWKKHIPFCQ